MVPRGVISESGSIKANLREVCAGICLLFGCLFAAKTAVAVEAPVGPILFEKPNVGKLEVIWFHPAFHMRTFSNLNNLNPSVYIYPKDDDVQALMVERLDVTPPCAIYNVATLADTTDNSPGSGMGFKMQASTRRASLTANPTGIEVPLESYSGNGRLDCYPNLSFSQGDSLFVGLQWKSGSPTKPKVGMQSDWGTLTPLQLMWKDGAINKSQPAPFAYSFEASVLDWCEHLGSENAYRGHTQFTPPQFSIWYGANASVPPGAAYDSDVINSDSLSWVTARKGNGVISLVAIDSLGGFSDTIRIPVVDSMLGRVSLNVPVITFDFGNPSSLTQQISVVDSGIGAVTLRLKSDNPYVTLSASELNYTNSGFKIITASYNGPQPSQPLTASLYIHNDRGWVPLKVDIRILTDTQTDVEEYDDLAKPKTFVVSEVYPNPNRGVAMLNVATPRSRRFKIDIYNVLGQLIQTDERQLSGESAIELRVEPTSDYPIANGVYFVRVSSGEETTMRKFVLVK